MPNLPIYQLVYLLKKLIRMNLYMFIARTTAFQFTVQYQWPEKCNAINLRGWSFYGSFFFDLIFPLFSKDVTTCTHTKIIASSNFKQIPIYLEINTLGKLLPTSYTRTFLLHNAIRCQGVGRICSVSICEHKSGLTWECYVTVFCRNCLQAKLVISRQFLARYPEICDWKIVQ